MLKKEIELLPLFHKFIKESENGKRVKKNGRKLKPDTIDNYRYVYANLIEFSTKNSFSFRLRLYDRLNTREREIEHYYWKKFYKNFTDFLYNKKNCHDNYVGSNIKTIRVFFNYIKNEKLISTGDFFKDFYVIREEIPIITLSFEQLQFLIFDTQFRASLSKSLELSMDIFIIGCTVALRISDIFNLHFFDIEKTGDVYYLNSRSLKTEVFTRIRLPEYAVDIINKYLDKHNRKKLRLKKKLLPTLSLNQFNNNIKIIAEKAGWTSPVGKTRNKRGQTNEKFTPGNKVSYRFCDLISSHAMRRTAITTMLVSGMPEHLVRKVSGHSNNSIAFYRYVNYSQAFLDNEIIKVHQRLGAIRNSNYNS